MPRSAATGRAAAEPDPTSGKGKPLLKEGLIRPLEAWFAYLELERGLSRNTLNAYRTDLLHYGAYLDERGLDAASVTHVSPRSRG